MTGGLSDFNRRLTVFGPAVADAGYYECEAVLRSSSVPSVSAGAFLHVYGRTSRHFLSAPAAAPLLSFEVFDGFEGRDAPQGTSGG